MLDLIAQYDQLKGALADLAAKAAVSSSMPNYSSRR